MFMVVFPLTPLQYKGNSLPLTLDGTDQWYI